MADRTKTSLVAASLFAGLLLTGCAEQEEALLFLHTPMWPDGEEKGTLACTADESSDEHLLRGFLDISFYSAYALPGVLQNNLLTTNAADNNSGIENGEVQIVDADVRLGMPQAPEIIDAIEGQNEALVKFTVNVASDSIPAGERYGIIAEVVTPETTEALEAQILSRFDPEVRIELLANVVVNAKRTGGNSGKLGMIKTREYTYPIELCYGCLTTCMSCPGNVCPPEGAIGWYGGVCGNAQDAMLVPFQCAEDQ